jgi:hypothetical protein
MKKGLRLFLKLLAVPLFLLFVGFGLDTVEGIPRHAIALLDDQSRTYTSPLCVSEAEARRLREAKVAEAYALNYNPEPGCRDQGMFIVEGRSLSGGLLESFGLIKPLPNRWNADGTWNW